MFKIQMIDMDGARLVVLREQDYNELTKAAGRASEGDGLPKFPKADKDGNVPALEYGRVSIARDIIRQRKELGLSQQELAKLAGVRQETVSRIETGKHSAGVRTIDLFAKVFAKAKSSR